MKGATRFGHHLHTLAHLQLPGRQISRHLVADLTVCNQDIAPGGAADWFPERSSHRKWSRRSELVLEARVRFLVNKLDSQDVGNVKVRNGRKNVRNLMFQASDEVLARKVVKVEIVPNSAIWWRPVDSTHSVWCESSGTCKGCG